MSDKKPHTIYKLSDGSIVPSVTTILGTVLSKEALVGWAYKCGVEGKDYKAERDNAAKVGTLVHTFINADLLNISISLEGYKEETIYFASSSFNSYLAWKDLHTIEPIICEQPLISEIHHFGGTPDFYGMVDGVLELVDYKSGSGVYEEAVIQTSTYCKLLYENGYIMPERIRILNIPREDNDKFKEVVFSNYETGWQIFLNCLPIYHNMKIIKKIIKRK
jgi:hypothetical protein